MTPQIPGFTPEQSWALEAFAERVADKAVAKYRDAPCASACPRMEEVRDTVYGNGTPGLKTEVTEMKKDLAGVAKAVEEHEEDHRKLRQTVMVTAVGAIGSLVVALIMLAITISLNSGGGLP